MCRSVLAAPVGGPSQLLPWVAFCPGSRSCSPAGARRNGPPLLGCPELMSVGDGPARASQVAAVGGWVLFILEKSSER